MYITHCIHHLRAPLSTSEVPLVLQPFPSLAPIIQCQIAQRAKSDRMPRVAPCVSQMCAESESMARCASAGKASPCVSQMCAESESMARCASAGKASPHRAQVHHNLSWTTCKPSSVSDMSTALPTLYARDKRALRAVSGRSITRPPRVRSSRGCERSLFFC